MATARLRRLYPDWPLVRHRGSMRVKRIAQSPFMRTDARTTLQRNRLFGLTPRKRVVSALALFLCLAVPLSQLAEAAEMYARAIGDDYLPAKPSPMMPRQSEAKSVPDLPALGASAPTTASSQGMSTWSKVLVGVVLVGAIAALGSHGAGAEGNVGLSGSEPSSPPAPTPSAPAPAPTPPPPTGGGGGSPLPLPLPPLPGGGDGGKGHHKH